jgi:hypothetical protein
VTSEFFASCGAADLAASADRDDIGVALEVVLSVIDRCYALLVEKAKIDLCTGCRKTYGYSTTFSDRRRQA